MDRNRDVITDHLPLEEIMISDIDGIQAPENWTRADRDGSSEFPPVLIEETRGYSLVGNHRTVWSMKNAGKLMVKCLVVRSTVHVIPAHQLISNCTEEAMLFEGILRRDIVPNRSRLADMLGYSRARITQLLNQLKLPLNIRQQVLLTDEVSEFKLRPLLKFLDDEPKLQAGFKQLMDGNLSGRQMADYTNSDNFQRSSEVVRKKSSDKQTDRHKNSIAELEDVFAAEEAEASGTAKSTVEKSTSSLDLPGKESDELESSEINMAVVLKELGNLRLNEWKLQSAEYGLPPIEMEFIEGVMKLRSGLYTEAVSIFSEVVSENPDHHLAWFYLGRCSNLTGELQEAEEYIRNAVSRYPDSADYLVELAVVLEKLKRHSEAEAFYKKSAVLRKAEAEGK